MPLTKRQAVAARLAQELRGLGADCVSPLPLRDGSSLRIHIREEDIKRVLQALKDGGWEAHFVSMLPQFYAPIGNMKLMHVYQVSVPDRQPVVGDRVIPSSEPERPEKSDAEAKAVRKYLGLE